MADRGTVVRTPDPFETDAGNPRPWSVVSGDRRPYSDEGSIAVAFATQSRHAGSVAVPSEAWIRGKPGRQSHFLPWTVATPKDDLHVVGRQGSVTDACTEQVTAATVSYRDNAEAAETE